MCEIAKKVNIKRTPPIFIGSVVIISLFIINIVYTDLSMHYVSMLDNPLLVYENSPQNGDNVYNNADYRGLNDIWTDSRYISLCSLISYNLLLDDDPLFDDQIEYESVFVYNLSDVLSYLQNSNIIKVTGKFPEKSDEILMDKNTYLHICNLMNLDVENGSVPVISLKDNLSYVFSPFNGYDRSNLMVHVNYSVVGYFEMDFSSKIIREIFNAKSSIVKYNPLLDDWDSIDIEFQLNYQKGVSLILAPFDFLPSLSSIAQGNPDHMVVFHKKILIIRGEKSPDIDIDGLKSLIFPVQKCRTLMDRTGDYLLRYDNWEIGGGSIQELLINLDKTGLYMEYISGIILFLLFISLIFFEYTMMVLNFDYDFKKYHQFWKSGLSYNRINRLFIRKKLMRVNLVSLISFAAANVLIFCYNYIVRAVSYSVFLISLRYFIIFSLIYNIIGYFMFKVFSKRVILKIEGGYSDYFDDDYGSPESGSVPGINSPDNYYLKKNYRKKFLKILSMFLFFLILGILLSAVFIPLSMFRDDSPFISYDSLLSSVIPNRASEVIGFIPYIILIFLIVVPIVITKLLQPHIDRILRIGAKNKGREKVLSDKSLSNYISRILNGSMDFKKIFMLLVIFFMSLSIVFINLYESESIYDKESSFAEFGGDIIATEYLADSTDGTFDGLIFQGKSLGAAMIKENIPNISSVCSIYRGLVVGYGIRSSGTMIIAKFSKAAHNAIALNLTDYLTTVDCNNVVPMDPSSSVENVQSVYNMITSNTSRASEKPVVISDIFAIKYNLNVNSTIALELFDKYGNVILKSFKIIGVFSFLPGINIQEAEVIFLNTDYITSRINETLPVKNIIKVKDERYRDNVAGEIRRYYNTYFISIESYNYIQNTDLAMFKSIMYISVFLVILMLIGQITIYIHELKGHSADIIALEKIGYPNIKSRKMLLKVLLKETLIIVFLTVLYSLFLSYIVYRGWKIALLLYGINYYNPLKDVYIGGMANNSQGSILKMPYPVEFFISPMVIYIILFIILFFTIFFIAALKSNRIWK